MMERRPWEVLVVRRGGRSFAERDAGILAAAGWTTTGVDARGLAGHLRAVREAFRADAVLCWFASVHTIGPLIVARARRIPFVVIPGSYEVAHVPELGYGWQGSAFRRAFVRRLLRGATSVVAVSPTIAELIQAAAGVEPVLVPNTAGDVPPPATEPPTYDVVTSAVLATAASRARKGIDLVLDAARACPDLRFLLVGPHQDLDLPVNLTVTGALPPDEAEACLARARVYVQATRGYEAFGSAVLEAMARGLVPVVSDAGSLPWVVGDAGLVIAQDDPGALVEGIRRAIVTGDPAAARARATEVFGADRRRRGLVPLLSAADQGLRR
jgi:glycosyltransferase involved in cell wall biosynthesis